MSAKPTARIGDDFLGYRPEELIGRGGMGVVYRARDLRLRRIVALKLMAPELAADERFRERFAREAELAMSLEHPNVVPIHDAGDVDGRLYLVMRFVEGTDLRTLLRAEGPLAPRRALAIGVQVAHALDAAHAKGLVHRDVKPSNVLLDTDEHVYLADFGLTRPFGESSAATGDVRSFGTPAYLAPEQIEGRAVDGRADVYSLGCLLHECLTGERPFGGSSRLAVAWAHLEEEPPRASERNADIPEEIDGVLLKAMAKRPDDRFATCTDLVAAAEDALGLGRRVSWRRRATLLAAVAMVVVGALAAALVTRGGAAAEAGPLEIDRNTLVRIDPKTNEIAAVVRVGRYPEVATAYGDTVWVYNSVDSSVEEIDAQASDIRHTTPLSTVANASSGESVLAADAGGAWIVGYRPENGQRVLTRILRDGDGKREIEFRDRVDEVVVAGGGIWLLAHRGFENVIIRVDPDTLAVTRRFPLPQTIVPARVAGLAVGGGYAWLTNESGGWLFRVDLRSGRVQGRDLGELILNPVFGFGSVWVCVGRNGRAAMMRVDPRTLRETFAGRGLPAEQGTYAVGFGSVWRHDVPSGTLMRFDPNTGQLVRLIRVLRTPGRATVTSIVAGNDALWVALA